MQHKTMKNLSLLPLVNCFRQTWEMKVKSVLDKSSNFAGVGPSPCLHYKPLVGDNQRVRRGQKFRRNTLLVFHISINCKLEVILANIIINAIFRQGYSNHAIS